MRKAYGYVTRMKDGKRQLLVSQHSIPEAGIQIPKGTVKPNEDTYKAVIRELEEETVKDFEIESLIAEDYWAADDGVIHNRFFYKITVRDAQDKWDHRQTGEGEEAILTFKLFLDIFYKGS